jgi:hypothetical protein
MKKISRQQRSREQALDRRDGLRVPKHAPVKRSSEKRDIREMLRRGGE